MASSATTTTTSEHRVCQIDDMALSSSAAASGVTFDSPPLVQMRPPFSTRTSSQPPPRPGLQVGDQDDKSGCNLSPLRCKIDPLFAATAMGPSLHSACSSLRPRQLQPVGLENIDPSGSVTAQWAIPRTGHSSAFLPPAVPNRDMNPSDEAGKSKRVALFGQRNVADRYQRLTKNHGWQLSGLATSHVASGAPGYQSFQIWRDLTDRNVSEWEEVQLLTLKVEMAEQAKSLALLARGISHIDHALQRALAGCEMVGSSPNGNGSLTPAHVATIQDENQIEDLPSGEGLVRARQLLVRVGTLDDGILCLEIGVQHLWVGVQINNAQATELSESRASLELKKANGSLEHSYQQSGPMISQEIFDTAELPKDTVTGGYLVELDRVRNRITTLRNARREEQALHKAIGTKKSQNVGH
jgi:hypothetical protein